ncbi:MAG: hypothetical protein CTY15_11100 [Methylocystis sp.]|nr:MAG: hypothetical protein CTY15_11100 [Methylocystis sp.]
MTAGGKVLSPFASFVAATLLAGACLVPASGSAQPPGKTTTAKSKISAQKTTAKAGSKNTLAPAKKTQQAKPQDAAKPKPAPPPAQTEAPKLSPFQPVDPSTPPPALPRASRERMRACAEEWEKKKMKTATGLPMWRDFATGCLTR